MKVALVDYGAGNVASVERALQYEAERQYRHILTLVPGHADSLHNLGLIALQRGDAAAAVELFDKAITINNKVAEYHYNVALAWRALNRNDHVATHLERAVALRADHALAHLNLGNVRRAQVSEGANGMAVDIFDVEPAFDRLPDWEKVRADVVAALDGSSTSTSAAANTRQS